MSPWKHSRSVAARRLWPVLGYLNRVRVRMEQRHFPADDRLYRMVVEARDKMHLLTVELHHMM